VKNPYEILGVTPESTDDEIKEAYRTLARKYHPDNYGDDNPLKDLANEKMQEINAAYDQIQKERGEAKQGGTYYNTYSGTKAQDPRCAEVRRLINSRRFTDAERTLASIPLGERGAEWHYLTSILLKRRGNVNDAIRELEIACNMEPDNLEYQRAKEMFNTGSRTYGSTYYGGDERQYRRRSSSDEACDCCANLICMDCLCECLGGDLIRCI
jgi:hypothetical protein